MPEFVLQVPGSLQRVTCHSGNLSRDFSRLVTIAQSNLMLHNEYFSCNLSCNVGKRNQLQVAEDMLHVAILQFF